MRRTRMAAACIAASTLLASGCATTSAGTKGGDAFVFAIKTDPGLLDPAQAKNGSSYTAVSLAYDTLVSTDASGRIVPGLADTWTVRPSSVTFALHKGATCADGSPVTPDTVAANVRYITNPKNQSPAYGILVPPDMTATPDNAAGTVTLSTPRPYSFILQSTRYLFIVCGAGLKDRRLLSKGTSGSGPFQLTSAEPNQSYTYIRRKDYTWGPAGVPVADRPGKVVLRVLPSEGTIANELLSHHLNGAMLAGPDRARVTNVPGLTATDQQNGTHEFFFHQGPGHPGSDPAVRKALLAAVNLTDLGAVVTSGTGRPPTGLVTQPRPCTGDTVTGHLPDYDPHAAAQQLDAAGWTQPSPGAIRVKNGRKLTFRFIYSSSGGETMAAAAEYLADAWKQVGADVRLRAVSDAAYFQVEAIEQNWDLNWAPLGVTLPSQLTGLLSGPFTPDGNNFAHIRNTTYDRLTAKAATLPVEVGCPLWNKAETALFKNADLIPVVDKTQTVAAYGATFRISSGMFAPTTIRMTGGSR
ncbi:ABC transporter substrate-binding protein [Streptomyces sp. CB03238]|uniref:ABC transporter substrate-binding protein n=1 Tax=Streptomyces sp. CB03238 TaxID=1907777 RepID=UPI001F4E2C25|nr:ABC transporter substrate-binding protein [Streptomyces sp. CB03238]